MGRTRLLNINLMVDIMTWIQPPVRGTLPLPRNAHTMSTVGNKLLLFGGHSGNKHLNDMHILDTSTMTWSQPDIDGQAPPGLRGHSANVIGEKVGTLITPHCVANYTILTIYSDIDICFRGL